MVMRGRDLELEITDHGVSDSKVCVQNLNTSPQSITDALDKSAPRWPPRLMSFHTHTHLGLLHRCCQQLPILP